MLTYDCGCINAVDEKTGVLRAVLKCDFHRQWSKDHAQGNSIDYFKSIGCISETGVPQNKRLIDELKDALTPDDYFYLNYGDNKTLLEFGPGLGPYIPFFLKSHWRYDAVEMAGYSTDWIANCFAVLPIPTKAESFFVVNDRIYDCIFAAHFVEHTKDAPTILRNFYRDVHERIYLIVPDDGDPTNPDHLWFFTQETLHALLETIGFKNVRSEIRKRVPQENFIYCVAEK